MNFKINKKVGISFVILIIIFGLFMIFFTTKTNNDEILRDRQRYHIIIDSNKNDVLKIEKKIFDISNIKYIKITRSNSETVYRIDDKTLMSDIISNINFEKFLYNQAYTMDTEDWTLEIGLSGKTSKFIFSNSSKIVKFNYNDTDFLLEVDDGFYNFMYELFGKLES